MITCAGVAFDPNFRQKTESGFKMCQKFVDSETVRLSDNYVPMKEGMLKKSGISGTVVGSGIVEYTAPYARRQYYTNSGMGKEGMSVGKGLRGKMWFERMKADHKDEIEKKAMEYFR